MSQFKYELESPVKLVMSGERGEILGRAEYAKVDEPSYYVRYLAGDGRLVESWWDEGAIEADS